MAPGSAFADPSNASNYSGGTPVKAGAITLNQVIEAHQGLPEDTVQPAAAEPVILTPPADPSAVGDMLMKGMASGLQEPAQTQESADTPKLRSPQLQNVIPAPSTAPMVVAPSLNAGMTPAPAPAPIPTPPTASPETLSTSPQAAVGCVPHVETWTRKCTDAGYPDEFVGAIKGETRTTCPAGALQDVWLSNTCAPPEIGASSAAPAPSPVVQPTAAIVSTSNLVDAACGSANGAATGTAPINDLCAFGIASRVNGTGPWTWACSGIDGGKAAACSAPKGEGAAALKRDAICGMASFAKHTNAPANDLCSVGTASGISGNGPWLWTCDGLDGGASVSCSADVSTAATTTGEQPPVAAVAAADVAPPAAKTAAAAAEAMPATSATSSEALTTPTTGVIAAQASVVRHETTLCGTASELAAFEAPTRDLCRAGTAGPMMGNGPWMWTCSDQAGHMADCSTLSPGSFKTDQVMPSVADAVAATEAAKASTAPANASPPATPKAKTMCGAAAGQGVEEKPTDELCAIGKASAVKGKGPWNWTCTKGKKKSACDAPKLVDAICGKANGSVRKGTPTTDLCKTGTPTAIQGQGPWLWSCVGSGGGISVSCSSASQTQTRVDGVCGVAASTIMTSPPTSNLCDSGTPSGVQGNGPWTWTCAGSSGGKDSSCATLKTAEAVKPVIPSAPGAVVNGYCGTSNGAAMSAKPLDRLCDAGTASAVTGDGPWSWNCAGSPGGITVSCTALSQGVVVPAVAPTASLLSPQPLNETSPAVPTAPNFPAAPTPSTVPMAPHLGATESPAAAAPALPQEAKALPPPPIGDALPPTPALKQSAFGTAPLANTNFALDEDMSTIPFDRGEENIDPAELPTLDKLADILVNNGNVRITLTSYANADGTSPREARRMSLTRALAVRDYLTAKGVVSSRIDVRALGSNVPSGDSDRIDVKVE